MDNTKNRYSSQWNPTRYILENGKGLQIISQLVHKGHLIKIWERIKYGTDGQNPRTYQKPIEHSYSYEYGLNGRTIVAGSIAFSSMELAIAAAKKSVENE